MARREEIVERVRLAIAATVRDLKRCLGATDAEILGVLLEEAQRVFQRHCDAERTELEGALVGALRYCVRLEGELELEPPSTEVLFRRVCDRADIEPTPDLQARVLKRFEERKIGK